MKRRLTVTVDYVAEDAPITSSNEGVADAKEYNAWVDRIVEADASTSSYLLSHLKGFVGKGNSVSVKFENLKG